MSCRTEKEKLTHYDSIQHTTLASNAKMIIDDLRNTIIAFRFDSS